MGIQTESSFESGYASGGMVASDLLCFWDPRLSERPPHLSMVSTGPPRRISLSLEYSVP
jgi:hypothetical protein